MQSDDLPLLDYATLLVDPPAGLTSLELPLATPHLHCGFPSAAQDHTEERLDLAKRLVPNETSTYFAMAHGDSMNQAGILHLAILVIDRSLPARNGAIVLAAIDGDFTVKRLQHTARGVRLMPDSSDPRYKPIDVKPEQDFLIWGVVRAAVNEFVRQSS